jgi:SpoVK/Ycf46/Vps4 family AAA+-type ATPase
MDLASVMRGLAKRGRGTLCLYGPSGTGKSDFVRHCASELGLPLISRRASDLLGMYVGQNEKNLAEMFREGRDAHGIILLDEADGFLRSRTGASRSFEVTLVNEMLVQMEAHAGIFVATTNLYDTLDAASLRRFDLKIRFDAPKEPQRWRMFLATLRPDAAQAAEDDPTTRAALARMVGLTPGDFATVARRAGVLDQGLDAATLLAALEEEWKAKPEAARRTVGFGRGE